MITPETEQKKPAFPLNVLLAIADLFNIYRPNEGDGKPVVGVYPPDGSAAKSTEQK